MMRYRQIDTSLALAPHLLGLGTGAIMVIGLIPVALVLLRMLT
jgi:hypothetical protein